MQTHKNKIIQLYNSFGGENVELFNWLDGLNYSQAFMICIGAGPWKIGRRQKIQGDALRWLGKRDLCDIKEPINCFPLEWQKNTTQNLINCLHKENFGSMERYCNFLKTVLWPNHARRLFYINCSGKQKGTKVLSLFCRDALKVDSFPIDRHVRRILKENELPTNEDDIIDVCREAMLDPRRVATAFVKTANVDNPNWKILIKDL